MDIKTISWGPPQNLHSSPKPSKNGVTKNKYLRYLKFKAEYTNLNTVRAPIEAASLQKDSHENLRSLGFYWSAYGI